MTDTDSDTDLDEREQSADGSARARDEAETTDDGSAPADADRDPDPDAVDDERDAGPARTDDAGDRRQSADPGEGTPGTEAPATDGGGADRSRVRRIVYWAALAGLMLFGGLMVLFVYSDVRGLIDVFVAREYQLLIETAFHLVLVLCVGIGVSLLVRRIEGLPG